MWLYKMFIYGPEFQLGANSAHLTAISSQQRYFNVGVGLHQKELISMDAGCVVGMIKMMFVYFLHNNYDIDLQKLYDLYYCNYLC